MGEHCTNFELRSSNFECGPFLGFEVGRSQVEVLQQGSAAAGRKPTSVPSTRTDRALPRVRPSLRVTTIPLGPALLTGSSDLPGGFGRAVLSRNARGVSRAAAGRLPL